MKQEAPQLTPQQIDEKKSQIANELLFSFWLLPLGFALGIALCFSPIFFFMLNIDPIALNYIYGIITEADLKEALLLNKWHFAPEEIAHLQDVKRVVSALLSTGAIMGFFALIWYKLRKPNLYYTAIHLNGLIAALVLVHGIVAVVNFKFLSDMWHGFLFPAGSWSFPKHSYVMTHLYPFSVMKIGATVILASAALFAISLFIIGYQQEKKKKKA